MVPLVDEAVCDKVVSYLANENVGEEQYDIYLGIRTEFDSRIYSVPSHVSNFIRKIKSEITISFTYSEPRKDCSADTKD